MKTTINELLYHTDDCLVFGYKLLGYDNLYETTYTNDLGTLDINEETLNLEVEVISKTKINNGYFYEIKNEFETFKSEQTLFGETLEEIKENLSK